MHSSSAPFTYSRPSTRNRPWTAQSRPVTAVSTRYEASYIVAVLEGRGLGREVGLAALDRDTGKMMLVQLSDCQTYVKTLHQMHVHNPCLILIPDTFLSSTDAALVPSWKGQRSASLLVEFIKEEFPGVQMDPVGRRYWNDVGGLEFIMRLCVEDNERAGTLLAVTNKYYALCAACALLKYAEAKLNLCFAQASLRIRYVPVEGTMMIDPDTAKNLELVGNLAYKKSTHSLFGILNHTFTAMAARLLRVNILSPITIPESINARLDVVEEFIGTEDRFTGVKNALKMLNKMDFDKLILASSEARVTNNAKPASARVGQLLNLRVVVKNVYALRVALEGSQSRLLRILHDMVSDERLTEIEELIKASLNEEGMPSKGGIGAVNARVYAVKANHNRLLDVARETYKENVSDIFELNRALTDKHDLPFALVYQEGGFFFTLRKTELEGPLPAGFINPNLKKGKWMFSSMELKKLNARMKDALDETLILSDKIIQELVVEILSHIGALYKASEAVALVDMLWSFARASILRPEFTGTLAIKSGRHPVLETIQAPGTLVPNDAYCDDASSFQIIQGPNMSGKSTYLRQIGLLMVMAMCGCYVPAEYASFRIHDALLTRLSNDDDLEKCLSTFASEMASSAMILGLATPRTLVLIDELGRGTSPREGVGISHAIAEGLIATKVILPFLWHFNELTLTLSRQPSVVRLHLLVQRSRRTASNFGLTFQYKIVDGAADDIQHYGLELARLADLPEDASTEASRVTEILTALQGHHEENSISRKIALRRKAMLKLRTQLTQTLEHSTLPNEELLTYLSGFQKNIARVFLQTGDI
ncbi:hypothetical protein BDN72DRAFT_764445 [Pluteus cervinus]|uniref:Uncharacterized protein n=1 Tax=Pluteus cervinus TaxID=181527 RepID=A0ACD3B1S1_9AGAR|nr:hypothetical protein BDN72DRAFT_764445 [Pluteus cervinus]